MWIVIILFFVPDGNFMFKSEQKFKTEAICNEHIKPMVDEFIADMKAGKAVFPKDMGEGNFRAQCALLDGTDV